MAFEAPVLAVDPDRHDIVQRAAVGDPGLLGLVEFGAGAGELHGGCDPRLVVVAGAAAQGNGSLRPLLELRPHLGREPEQEANHLGRQGCRQLADHLGSSAG